MEEVKNKEQMSKNSVLFLILFKNNRRRYLHVRDKKC